MVCSTGVAGRSLTLRQADFDNVNACVGCKDILPEVFYKSEDGECKEEELYSIADGSHKAAASQVHAALYPKPTWRYSIRPSNNANNEADDGGNTTND